MKRILWSEKEDEICCKTVVDEYVIGRKDTYIEDCITDIKSNKDIAERDRGSIRMRFQNIKELLEEMGVPNTLSIKPLANAAKQTRRILMSYLENAGYLKSSEGKE